MDVSHSSRPCMRVDWRFEARRKDLRPMASSRLSSADMVDSFRGLAGSGTTGREAAAPPSAPV